MLPRAAWSYLLDVVAWNPEIQTKGYIFHAILFLFDWKRKKFFNIIIILV